MDEYSLLVSQVCRRALAVFNLPPLHFLPMRRRGDQVNTKHGFIIGRTNLKTGLITIDIFTPKFRKPKAIASILRTLAHEAAHHQKPPYRSRYKGHIINRNHYPVFYRQVARNIKKLKKDKILRQYFTGCRQLTPK
ncbi:MAG: hypothetical protein PHS62_03465 [Patescibacteria group bacterium]|nr:hypothetical protein [Patescibacteria group bacterium]